MGAVVMARAARMISARAMRAQMATRRGRVLTAPREHAPSEWQFECGPRLNPVRASTLGMGLLLHGEWCIIVSIDSVCGVLARAPQVGGVGGIPSGGYQQSTWGDRMLQQGAL
jgi:hypothetical protein